MRHPVRSLALLAALFWHGLAMAGAPLQAAARSWLLYDATARQTLAAENAGRRFEPASLTKLMTAYLAFQAIERGKLAREQVIRPSDSAAQAAGSRMYVDDRHPATVQQLLQGLVTVNANDAALALAEAVAGSEAGFVARMNEQAARLGMADTRFANASGRPEPQHYSTPQDMLRLAEALLRDYPADYPLFAATQFSFNGVNQPARNRLLQRDPAIDGLMTGQTPASGYGIVASSKRGDRRLIVVLTGVDSERMRTGEAQRLLNLGFTRWEVMRVGGIDKSLVQAQVWKGESREVGLGLAGETLLAVPRDRSGRVRPVIEVRQMIEAPVSAGQSLGRLRLMAGDELLAEYPLVARESVALGSFIRRMIDTARLWLR